MIEKTQTANEMKPASYRPVTDERLDEITLIQNPHDPEKQSLARELLYYRREKPVATPYGTFTHKVDRSGRICAGLARLLAILALAIGLSLSARAQSCGAERRDVKTLTDSAQIHPEITATVEALRHLKAPAKWGGNLARLPAEQQSYRVSALLLGYKLEADGDYHLVISSPDSVKRTMIAEIPSPECAPKRAAEFKSQRDALAALAKPRAKGKMQWFTAPIPAQLVGVLFFDKLHRQTGVAPNGAELHPLLSIEVRR